MSNLQNSQESRPTAKIDSSQGHRASRYRAIPSLASSPSQVKSPLHVVVGDVAGELSSLRRKARLGWRQPTEKVVAEH
jgi:hypothetical protein